MPGRFSREIQPPFQIEIASSDREVVVVRPQGELDLATEPDLARAIGELRAAGWDAIRLDLRGLTFIDSTGLRLVHQLSCDPHRPVTVVPGPPNVTRAFALAGYEMAA